MRFYEAKNDKPPLVGSEGLTRLGGSLYADFALRRKGIVNLGCTLVNISYASAILDGETTRRIGLNLDRGGQPLGTRRIVGKREWQQGKPCQKLPTADGSVSHITARFRLGVTPFRNRADSPSVIRGITW